MKSLAMHAIHGFQITGIITFLINTETVAMTTDFLHLWFQTATSFKGMTPVSGGSLTIPKMVVMTMIGILAMPTLCLLNMWCQHEIPKGPSVKFFWPNREDVCWVPIQDVKSTLHLMEVLVVCIASMTTICNLSNVLCKGYNLRIFLLIFIIYVITISMFILWFYCFNAVTSFSLTLAIKQTITDNFFYIIFMTF